MRLVDGIVVCFVTVLAWGCGGAPTPVDQRVATEASIRGAKEAGAEQEPAAKLYLKLADEQLGKAKKLIDDGDNEEALALLQRAESDADLAHALAKKKASEDAAAEAAKAVDKVKKDK
jgi:hypothetical protein